MKNPNEIATRVVHGALRVHKKLGPGLMESVYENILARDLIRQGYHVEQQKSVSFEFEGMWFENAFRADLVIEHAVVVEVKSVVRLSPVHKKQLLTYLRLLDCRLGLLLNFGGALMKDGIKRVVNDL